MRLTRRELIAAMLGAPALAAGCSPLRSAPPVSGQLLGQSVSIGHRLREGFRPTPAAGAWRDVQVAIVGGGLAGLSAAWRLRQQGLNDFVVLELEPVEGGTSRSGRSPVSAYPWGAHYVPVPLSDNRPLIDLLAEMGVVESIGEDGSPVVSEQYLCREPEERLFVEGEWIEGLYPAVSASPEDLAELTAFQREMDHWVRWRDSAGRRAFAIPTRHCSDDPVVLDLDKLSMAQWLNEHGWTSRRLRWLVDYSCRDDYGLTADQTSAWAGLLYFVARLKDSGSEPQPLITFPEGNGRIVAHLARQTEKQLLTGVAVTQVTPVADQVEVIAFDTKTSALTGYRARQVIFTAPQFLAPRLITGFRERTGRDVNEFQYGSWLVANLHLRGRPKETSFPLSWDNVIYDSPSLGYVVATHQTGQDHGPTILTWYYPYCGLDPKLPRQALLEATWEDLAEVVLTDLQRPHPDLRELIERLDLFRWGHAMIQPRPGFITSRQRREAGSPDGRIHFANTDLSGLALLEEAFDHGCRAADEVLGA